ncbi:hypothetical protein TNCV_3389341 [Trichonephila clavipes]|nr:hypothetical protein TNCV_3389341 [Trichonephila clavipes]
MSSLEQSANIKSCVFLEKSPERRSRCRRKYMETIPAIEDFYLFPWLKMKLKGRRFVWTQKSLSKGFFAARQSDALAPWSHTFPGGHGVGSWQALSRVRAQYH